MKTPKSSYVPRLVDDELDAMLSIAGAVVIEGPRACGKTETALQRARSVVRLEQDDNARQLARIDADALLSQEAPLLIDEWQLEPALWNTVRNQVDARFPERGQFILTGSSTPDDDARRHSGAGRMIRLPMRPMTLAETGHSSGAVSLAELMESGSASGAGESFDIPTLVELVTIGGWPGNLGATADGALRLNQGYVDQIVEFDLPRLMERRRDPQKLRRLMMSLARNVGTQVSVSKLAREAGGADASLDRGTVSQYLDELARMWITEDLPAWNTHLRSRDTLMKGAKRFFVDPSLAVATLGATPARLLKDLAYFGFLFENLVIRDLRVYAQLMDAQLFHARLSDNTEVDAVVECRNGTWAAFEVKLGHSWVEEAATGLKRFAAKVDTRQAGEPAALVVVVPNGQAYTRPDGVSVVPLSALTR